MSKVTTVMLTDWGVITIAWQRKSTQSSGLNATQSGSRRAGGAGFLMACCQRVPLEGGGLIHWVTSACASSTDEDNEAVPVIVLLVDECSIN